MWQDDNLKNHILEADTLKSSSFVTAEWNLNDWENIERVGNYRYRPTTTSPYSTIEPYYDPYDAKGAWKNSTDSDVEVFGPYDDDGNQETVLFKDDRFAYYYSLDDCFSANRPRSGINKVLWFHGKHIDDISDVDRPRYYLAHHKDKFKYWTSWHTEKGAIYGVSDNLPSTTNGTEYKIFDAAPFVVYKENIKANKIALKFQTNITRDSESTDAEDRLGNAKHDGGRRYRYSTTPVDFYVQVLKKTGSIMKWENIVSFAKDTGTATNPFIRPDGYVELVYSFSNWNDDWGNPKYMGELPNDSFLPNSGVNGRYYVVGESTNASVYVFHDNKWNQKTGTDALTEGWRLRTNFNETGEHCVKNYASATNSLIKEVDEFMGIRVVTNTMNKKNTPLDLIEISPRLKINITDHVKTFEISKSMGKVDELALPVSGLKPSTGSVTIFDEEQAFNPYYESDDCLIDGLEDKIVEFGFFDVITAEDSNDILVDHYIPIKYLSSEGIGPDKSGATDVTYSLRDKFYLLEKEKPPNIFLRDLSLSYAVTVLLDSIGFSNFTFVRTADGKVPRIPYFYVSKEKNVAEVLEQLALATQSVMYFDEKNNFVVKSKESLYDDKDADMVFYGNPSKKWQQPTTSDPNSGIKLPSIQSIDSLETKVYTKGTLTFNQRYIQRTMGSLEQFNYSDEDKEWIYLPALLWEASGDLVTRSINEKAGNASGYGLTALALDRPLSNAVPTYNANAGGTGGVDKVENNEIYFGAAARWMYRYAGYFYAGGEVIKYDAVEWAYTDSNDTMTTSWVENTDQWSKIFGNLPFRGKMYPTGKVRIYAEVENGKVISHGRGQFGTEAISHSAGLPSEWRNNTVCFGFKQDTEKLFSPYEMSSPYAPTGPSDSAIQPMHNRARKSQRSGKMKDFLKEAKVESNYQPATVQASALNFKGRPNVSKPSDFISIQTKRLALSDFKHFGTRMRVIGKIEAGAGNDTAQTAAGYFNIEGYELTGGSGGIVVGYNVNSGSGYYFEILALSNINRQNEEGEDEPTNADNVILWKIDKNGKTHKLWGGFADIVVDSGDFAGQGRLVGEDLSTVFDLDIEYVKKQNSVVLYLFINNNLVGIYEDSSPVEITNRIGLFVRGESRCMFENVFAIRQNVTQSVEGNIVKQLTSNNVFQIGSQQGSQSATGLDFVGLKKYGISGFVKESYLKDLSNNNPIGNKLYYEEFGTIMREAAFVDADFDKAYPALNAKPSPSVSLIPGYAISGYESDAYSAQFFIMNVTDTFMNLDEQTGNYLTLLGVAFTQENQYEISMDDYFEKHSKIADSWIDVKENYKQLKIKRLSRGEDEWSFNSDYLQTWDAADDVMGFLIDRTTRERTMIGMTVFPMPMLQLGDVVTVNYELDGKDYVDPAKKFVVYNIEYNRSVEGPTTKVYISEV